MKSNRGGIWAPLAFCALAIAGVPVAPSAFAQTSQFSDGTYILEGGSYSIEVTQEGGRLTVVEPNKTSVYERQADGTYHFYNPNTDTVYGLRVVDNQTIEAFEPFVRGNAPTRLVRLGGAPAPRPAAPPAPDPAPVARSVAKAALPSNPPMKIAERYQQLALDDPDNAQAWTFCAAAALKRAMATGEEADAYAWEAAERLKLIMTDPRKSPCEDAIPPSAWTAAEERSCRAPGRGKKA